MSSLGVVPQSTGPVIVARARVRAALASLLISEIALFVWSFGKFFNGDSLFFLWFRIDERAALAFGLSERAPWLAVFTQADHLHSYRPLTYVITTWLLYPLFHLNTLGYHVVALGTHLLITLIAFRCLREWVSPGAALAGAFFFGVHSVNFYITYDLTCLPDYSSALFMVMALLGYVLFRKGRGAKWLVASLGSFVLALLCKENAITLLVGFAAAEVLCAGARAASPVMLAAAASGDNARLPAAKAAVLRRALLGLAPCYAVGASYLAWSLHLKAGHLYPSGNNEPYAFTLAWDVLKLKARYLAWICNLPLPLGPHGWLGYAACVAMLPALGFILFAVVRASRTARWQLLACLVWALATLGPVLVIQQTPMKHNLYVPVLALGVGLAVAVERSRLLPSSQHNPAPGAPLLAEGDAPLASRSAKGGFNFLPRGWAFLVLGMFASTALMMPGDLRASWVGAASDIAEASLNNVRAGYPALPRGATLYLLPTRVKGDVSWYFQNGALFNLFYNDESLQMRFADRGQELPANFASRPDVLVFDFADNRIWDVTRSYKRNALDRESIRLLDLKPAIESRLKWERDGLIEGQSPAAKRSVVRNGRCRSALVQMPGTVASFPLGPVPPDSVLEVGLTVAGPRTSYARARIFFESSEGVELLDQLTTDALIRGKRWADWEIDLSRLAGRSGKLRLEADPTQEADWIAWSRLRVVSRFSRFYPDPPAEIDQAIPPRALRLLDRVDDAQVTFDRTEYYPDYSNFGTPTGGPVFLYANSFASPARYVMVTLAGVTARFSIDRVPPGAVLELSAVNSGTLGYPVHGRVLVEAGEKTVVFDAMLAPKARTWIDREIPLKQWEGRPITLTFESSSGPKHLTAGNWCSWGRLRIVSR